MSGRLYVFNPTNEMAIANGQVSYMPPAHLRRFENDLAALPWMFAEKRDFILVGQRSGNSLKHLVDLGWEMPTIVTSPEEIPSGTKLEFSPWGWSPAIYNKLKPFFRYATAQWQEHPFSRWDNRLSHLLSRETGYRLLNEIRVLWQRFPQKYDLLEVPAQPITINNFEQLSHIFKKITPPAVVKTPWSASGRGLFRIRNYEDDPSQSDWVRGMLKRQGKVYIEKMLSGIQDVSFQFIIKNNIQYQGHNFFYTDVSGQFEGCAVGYPVNPSPHFRDTSKVLEALHQGRDIVQEALKRIGIETLYWGPAGIDGLFFENEKKEMKLHPCLEINLRYNMGLANICLQKRIHSTARGKWKTALFKQESWTDFCKRKKRENPLKMEDKKIKKGFLPLIDADTEKLFGAWLELE